MKRAFLQIMILMTALNNDAIAQSSGMRELLDLQRRLGTCDDPRLDDNPDLKFLLCATEEDIREREEWQRQRNVYLETLRKNWGDEFDVLTDEDEFYGVWFFDSQLMRITVPPT